MTLQNGSLDKLREEVFAGLLTRRSVLKRGMALGLSAPIIASLLAACGDDDEPEATAPPAADPTEAPEEEPEDEEEETPEDEEEEPEETPADEEEGEEEAPDAGGERGGLACAEARGHFRRDRPRSGDSPATADHAGQ